MAIINDAHCCFICDEPFKAGQLVLSDVNEGLGHRACFGEDREGYVDLDTGEPLGPDDPIPSGEPYDPADYAEPLRNAQSEAVAVKALEWHKSHMPSWNGDWHTTSPFIYTVRCADENGWKWSAHGGCGYASTPESAKAAAQADFDKRIRSALTHPAPPLAVTDEMRLSALPDVDVLAQIIRGVDHPRMGAGLLAEAILSALTAALEAKQ